MALELYRAIDCVEYVGQDPKIPALRVELTEPLHEHRVVLTAPVDTGFGGYILVDTKTYEQVGTAELPKNHFGTYQTMAGQIVLRRARVLFRLAGREFESYVETPLHGTGKILLGRRILHMFDLALFGSVDRCCHLSLE